ncbi:MAG TPA: HEAT repeat domain-containing protein [Phycisphaerae bacterium]|nr:HEAT repeat domain-containing protein [Phycisphaerae bacterium]
MIERIGCISITLAIAGVMVLAGCQVGEDSAAKCLPVKKASADEVILRYTLPASQIRRKSEGDVGVIIDPTDSRFIENRLSKHLQRIWTGFVGCGLTSHTLLTPAGPIEQCGAEYFGSDFDEEDMVSFLRHRLGCKTVEKEIRVTDPKLVAKYKRLLTRSEKAVMASLTYSPWDRDTANVVSLLSCSRDDNVRHLFKRLSRDRSEAVRFSSMWALAGLARYNLNQKAIDDLMELLPEDDLRANAASALSDVGKVAVPKLILGMKSSDEELHKGVLRTLKRMKLDEVSPVMQLALTHEKMEFRKQAVGVTLEMLRNCNTQKLVKDDKFINVLKSLTNDKDEEISTAAIIILECIGLWPLPVGG